MGGRGDIYPPWRISQFSIGKRYQRGVKGVCKFKFSNLGLYQKDFRSKHFFWAEPRAFKVEWVANFRISKSWIFLLLPQNFATNQGIHSKFSHPTPRTAYQCPYAKEMRWIGPKMTELEPFSWTRSKFAIFDELKIWHFGWILISAVRAQFGGIDPICFLLPYNYL